MYDYSDERAITDFEKARDSFETKRFTHEDSSVRAAYARALKALGLKARVEEIRETRPGYYQIDFDSTPVPTEYRPKLNAMVSEETGIATKNLQIVAFCGY